MNRLKVLIWITVIGFLTRMFTVNGVSSIDSNNYDIDQITINAVYHAMTTFLVIVGVYTWLHTQIRISRYSTIQGTNKSQ